MNYLHAMHAIIERHNFQWRADANALFMLVLVVSARHERHIFIKHFWQKLGGGLEGMCRHRGGFAKSFSSKIWRAGCDKLLKPA